jgi:hypothetical protein
MQFSKHAQEMLVERNIREEWVWRTLNAFDNKEIGTDNNLHYTKSIEENESRILRVVVNPSVEPARIVTIFFDRRLKRKK